MTLYDTVTIIWHGTGWLWARCNNDGIGQHHHKANIDRILSLDHQMKNLLTSIIPAVIFRVAGISQLFPIAIFGLLVTTIYDIMLVQKKWYGGWSAYARQLLFGVDGRTREWSSPMYDALEEHITDELRCSITLNIV